MTGCACSLSHIETQKRMRATYAGFPPVFANAELNAFRARYLSEKAIFDQDRNAFMGLDGTAQSCPIRSEEHTYELQSLMRISYAAFCLKKKKNKIHQTTDTNKHIYQ